MSLDSKKARLGAALAGLLNLGSGAALPTGEHRPVEKTPRTEAVSIHEYSTLEPPQKRRAIDRSQWTPDDYRRALRTIVSEILFQEFEKPPAVREQLEELQREQGREERRVMEQARASLEKQDLSRHTKKRSARGKADPDTQYAIRMQEKIIALEHGPRGKHRAYRTAELAPYYVSPNEQTKYEAIIDAVIEKFRHDSGDQGPSLANVLARVERQAETDRFKNWLRQVKRDLDGKTQPPRYALGDTK